MKIDNLYIFPLYFFLQVHLWDPHFPNEDEMLNIHTNFVTILFTA